MGASISANHENHSFRNSKRVDSDPIHNSKPTRTRTYIHPPPPLPAGLLTASYGHTASYWLCHFPAPTQPGINTPHKPSTDILHSPAYEDGTDSEFRNVGNPAETPRAKNEVLLDVGIFCETKENISSTFFKYYV